MPPPPLQPPEVPQLRRGRIAEESAAPAPKTEAPKPLPRQRTPADIKPQAKAAPPDENGVQLPRPAPQAAAPRKPATAEEANAAIRNATEMMQSERDFFLSQIVDHMFINLDAPQFKGIRIVGAYIVEPDGMMAAPFDKNMPFDMSRMMDARTWELIQQPRHRSLRVAMESFLRGMYLAQPLQLPPNFGNLPKRMTLDFNVSDLR